MAGARHASRREGPGIGLRGREGLTSLVGECLTQPHTAERPVITLMGMHGSGASEAHGTLMAEFGETQAPFAYLNFGSRQPLLPRYALALIARQLERKLPQYRVSRFPRLTLGLLASDTDVGLLEVANVDRARQRRHLRHRLDKFEEETFERYGDYLTGFLQVGRQALGLPDEVPQVFEDIVLGAARQGARTITRRRFTGIAHWYGAHPLTGGTNPWDAVVDVNHWRRSGSQEDAEKLDRILFAAFLEDMRRNAEQSFAPTSYLLLLDNCHTAHGRRFLDLLILARRDDHAWHVPHDPLTTVASTNRWLPRWGSSSGRQWRWATRDPDGAALDDWRARRPPPTNSDAWWYPLRLRDLSLDEVRVRLSAEPQRDPALAPFVHRLTCGLPRAVHQVTALLDRADVPAGSGRERDAWLRTLPDRKLPSGGRHGEGDGVRLVDAALGQLLEGFTETEQATLAECAAAVDLSVATQVLGGSAPAHTGTSLFGSARAAFLLFAPGPPVPAAPARAAQGQGQGAAQGAASGPPAAATAVPGAAESPGAGPPTLHPWLRRLLLWRLAQRSEEDWDTAHGLLSEHFKVEGLSVQEMYHRLAMDRVELVTEHLTRRYLTVSTRQWIAEFNAITSAPNRLPHDRDHRDLVAALTPASPRTGSPVESAVRALIVARWVWSDPLADPEMRLNQTIAERFARLSEFPRSDNLHLFNEAERYGNWLPPQTCAVEG